MKIMVNLGGRDFSESLLTARVFLSKSQAKAKFSFSSALANKGDPVQVSVFDNNGRVINLYLIVASTQKHDGSTSGTFTVTAESSSVDFYDFDSAAGAIPATISDSTAGATVAFSGLLFFRPGDVFHVGNKEKIESVTLSAKGGFSQTQIKVV